MVLTQATSIPIPISKPLRYHKNIIPDRLKEHTSIRERREMSVLPWVTKHETSCYTKDSEGHGWCRIIQSGKKQERKTNKTNCREPICITISCPGWYIPINDMLLSTPSIVRLWEVTYHITAPRIPPRNVASTRENQPNIVSPRKRLIVNCPITLVTI